MLIESSIVDEDEDEDDKVNRDRTRKTRAILRRKKMRERE
jgi:hypothetical protein